ncbi:hypothetical protein BDR07DRAFT_1546670 [Suillus spraguei]|nr:hypothetical protein BDR07DRAFT_1546670 [Suillus spraguei]
MHTQPEDRLDIALANKLQRSFAWVPPLTSDSCSSDNEFLAGPESMTDEELLEEFSRFENEAPESHRGKKVLTKSQISSKEVLLERDGES